MQVGFVDSNSFFKLLNIFCPSLPESGLGLTVALFAFLGSSIDLEYPSVNRYYLCGV